MGLQVYISLVMITLKLFHLGVGELRRETGEPVLVAVDYRLQGFILAVGSLILAITTNHP